MNLKKKLMYSLIFSAGYLIASIVMPLVPCRIAPNVPSPLYQWTLCSLNPNLVISLNSIKEYWGYTTSLTDAYFITIILAFLASMIVLHYTTRKRKKE